MREIAVGEAEVGDVVAKPVVNDRGRVLLPVGSRLSAAVLSRLSSWGVERVTVEGGEPEEPVEAGSGADAPDVDEALELRFSEWEGDELMMAIKQIARRHLAGR